MSRLFFALWPGVSLRDSLAAWARDHAPAGARPVPPDNLHLTLAFLGTLPEERLSAVHAAGAAVRGGTVSFDLAYIEYWARPRLLCAVPAAGSETCVELVAALRESLTRHRLPVESRPFKAHVTLARKVRKPFQDYDLGPVPTWLSDRLALVVSEGSRSGVRYRELAGWPLGAGR